VLLIITLGARLKKAPYIIMLGQAKLIIRFPFQGFQNNMREGGHFSLFIMTKILRNQLKKPHQYNNENL